MLVTSAIASIFLVYSVYSALLGFFPFWTGNRARAKRSFSFVGRSTGHPSYESFSVFCASAVCDCCSGVGCKNFAWVMFFLGEYFFPCTPLLSEDRYLWLCRSDVCVSVYEEWTFKVNKTRLLNPLHSFIAIKRGESRQGERVHLHTCPIPWLKLFLDEPLTLEFKTG